MKKFQKVLLRLFLPVILLYSSAAISCQDRFPNAGLLFDNSSIARVDVSIDPDSLGVILTEGNEGSDYEYMATFTFTRGNFTQTIDSVGFRLRGNTSRYSGKKSFKVSLNTFIPGQKFQGVEKINLNGEHNDPSVTRALTCWTVFREAQVPGSRANHVRLYINGEYKGLYLNVEHVDEEFIDLRFGNNNGNLYKCLWPADLVYLGDDPSQYKYENDGRRAYELKTNEIQDDYSDLARFIDVLNNTDPTNFDHELNRVFNINGYLKNLAVEELTGHWDAYSFNKNNYYLYYNEGTRKFEYIPYDPDNTLGINFIGDINWATRDLYDWSNQDEPRPLTDRILMNQTYRDRFSWYVHQLLSTNFNNENLDPFLDSVKNQVLDAAEEDPYMVLDWGFSFDDFIEAFEQARGGHVTAGLKPYIADRTSTAIDQLELNPIDPIITLLYVNQPEIFENARVQFRVEDDNKLSQVKAWFGTGNDFYEVNTEYKGDDLYEMIHPGLSSDGVLKFYITATDENMNTTREPAEGWYSIYYGVTSVRRQAVGGHVSFSIHPNPVYDVMQLTTREDITAQEYAIYDLSGRKVISGTLVPGAGRIMMEPGMQDGLYLLELKYETTDGETGKAAGKFVLRRN